MPGLTEIDLKQTVRRQVCASGETIFYVTPANQIGHVTSMHIDAAYASGLASNIQLQVRDVYSPTGGSSSTVTRYQTRIQAGDIVDLALPAIQCFGSIRVDANLSGPIVSLGATFR